MKHIDNNCDDIEFGKILKSVQPEAGKNEWFTRKVMNRLPEKQRHGLGWLMPMALTVSLIICLAGWVYFLQNLNMNVILVRDVVSLVALFAVTIVVIWQFLHALFVAD